ncbi:hypothetical protein NEMIN01_0638 [Nematocida minor]|uniref:uncharacterized protein n=1 Tax=Nematocida minor TaxID=1912983 RepID=UPI00222002DF|nr:uncharacterized protein NEMIN01_0638 [Nematocida minor]KAI5189685.1 hypothetical protein NEMIN01_0638 [Nematocida minor]
MGSWIKPMVVGLQEQLGCKWIEIGCDIMQCDVMTQAIASQENKLSESPYKIIRKNTNIGKLRAHYREYVFEIEKLIGSKSNNEKAMALKDGNLPIRINDGANGITAYLSKNALDYLKHHENVAVSIESLLTMYGRLLKGYFIVNTNENRRISLYIEKMSYIGERPETGSVKNRKALRDINDEKEVYSITQKIKEEISIYRACANIPDIQEQLKSFTIANDIEIIDPYNSTEPLHDNKKISHSQVYIKDTQDILFKSIENGLEKDQESDAVINNAGVLKEVSAEIMKECASDDKDKNNDMQMELKENTDSDSFSVPSPMPASYVKDIPCEISPTKKKKKKKSTKKNKLTKNEDEAQAIILEAAPDVQEKTASPVVAVINQEDSNADSLKKQSAVASPKSQNAVKYSPSSTASPVQYVANITSPIKKAIRQSISYASSNLIVNQPIKSDHLQQNKIPSIGTPSCPVTPIKSKKQSGIEVQIVSPKKSKSVKTVGDDTLDSVVITPSVLKTINTSAEIKPSKDAVSSQKADESDPAYYSAAEDEKEEWSSVEEISETQANEMIDETISNVTPVLTISEYLKKQKKENS